MVSLRFKYQVLKFPEELLLSSYTRFSASASGPESEPELTERNERCGDSVRYRIICTPRLAADLHLVFFWIYAKAKQGKKAARQPRPSATSSALILLLGVKCKVMGLNAAAKEANKAGKQTGSQGRSPFWQKEPAEYPLIGLGISVSDISEVELSWT